MKKMYSFNEIGLIPAIISKIKSRKDVNPFYLADKLPIFVAPMTCLINKENYNIFKNSNVIPVYPIWHNESVEDRIKITEGNWFSVTLSEFEEYFSNGKLSINVEDRFYKVLIDCAQGHMEGILTNARKAKDFYGNKIVIMAGNIANPDVYPEYCKAGIDFVRVSVGSGAGCHKDGTMITMADGSKKAIEKVRIGDFVKTLNGEGAVTATIRYKTNKCVKINNSIVSTPDHKFLVIKKSDKDIITEENINKYAFYLEANKLTNEYLLIQSV